ncbi:unnamed protein product [Penicillium pancosmium]
MAPASATDKLKKHSSRASSTSKPDPDIESPISVSASDLPGSEPAYLKELQKSLRNAVKKLNATAKVDAILAENKGKSLDELVEAKKINNDQKAQALKKPALQASIAQIEEQIEHYKQIADQYEERLVSQKAALEKTHQEELEAVRANAIADATETTAKVLRQQLLTVSKFLCAAANSRRDGDAEALESRAFEGVLYQVYGGNQDAVSSMIKLIDGADEKIQGVEGDLLDLSFGDVKQASSKFAPPEPAELATETTPASDPTLANAGLTELQDTSVRAEAAAQENLPTSDQVAPPSQTLVSEAGNAVAETSYNGNSMTSSATTDGWVNVPRDPAETDTGLQATPANTENTEAEAKGQSGGRIRNNNNNRQGGRGRGEGSRGGRSRGEFRGRGRGGGGRGGRGRGGANGSPTGEQ